MRRALLSLLLLLSCTTVQAVTTVKILFVYTPNAIAHLGANYLVAFSNAAISAFTTTLSNNQINGSVAVASAGSFALPGEYQITKAEAVRASTSLPIAYLRDASGADVVVVVGSPSLSACGWSTDVMPQASLAFSVVAANCFGDGTTVQHEVGHLMGLRHQTPNGPDHDNTISPAPYTNNHGYLIDTFFSGRPFCYYDLMANPPSTCVSDGGLPQQLNVYSSPTITLYNNTAISQTGPTVQGGSVGSPYYAYAASVLLSSMPIVANNHLVKTTPHLVSSALAGVWNTLFGD